MAVLIGERGNARACQKHCRRGVERAGVAVFRRPDQLDAFADCREECAAFFKAFGQSLKASRGQLAKRFVILGHQPLGCGFIAILALEQDFPAPEHLQEGALMLDLGLAQL